MEGHYETQAPRAADPVRHARRRGGDHPLQGGDPLSRLADPHPFLGRRGAGPQGLPAPTTGPRPRSSSGPSGSWSALGFAMLGPRDSGPPGRAGAVVSTTSRSCCARRSRWGPLGFVAVLCGWITTEVGRQPFTVYGLLTTADSVSPIAVSAVASLARRLHRRLLRGLRRRDLLPAATDEPAAGTGAPDDGRLDGADPRRRHHAGGADRPRRAPGGVKPCLSISPSSGPG